MTSHFAYGPDMNPAFLQDEYGVQFTSRVAARLSGFRLSFNVPDITAPGAGLANILGDPKDTVAGALYEVSAEALERLDRHHGVKDGRCTRVVLSVTTSDGESVRAETYVGDERVYHEGLQPTRDAIVHMLEASDILDDEYRSRLEAFTALEA